MLIGNLGPWLAAEYMTVPGQKAPRPFSGADAIRKFDAG
jgi:hypothetical protein